MDVKNIIEQLGGRRMAAEFFEISQPAIAQWVAANKIPQARLLHLKAARPELFDHKQDDQIAA